MMIDRTDILPVALTACCRRGLSSQRDAGDWLGMVGAGGRKGININDGHVDLWYLRYLYV